MKHSRIIPAMSGILKTAILAGAVIYAVFGFIKANAHVVEIETPEVTIESLEAYGAFDNEYGERGSDDYDPDTATPEEELDRMV